jgi:predicted ribonuclease YlaK
MVIEKPFKETYTIEEVRATQLKLFGADDVTEISSRYLDFKYLLDSTSFIDIKLVSIISQTGSGKTHMTSMKV